MQINETTRTFPRTLEEAFPDNVQDQQRLHQGEWMESHQDPELTFQDAQFWVYITCAFAAGFVVSQLWG